MKKSLFFFVALVVLGVAAGTMAKAHAARQNREMTLEARAEKALVYARRHGMNDRYCLLLDYSIPSGQPRLFLWSSEKEKVVYKAHAMHGPGLGSTAETPVFSNRRGSMCSSLGKFEVTREHGVRNKTGYRLRGLDFSNCAAYSRGIMVHSSRWVDVNSWRRYIPLQPKCCQGCVTISTRAMNRLGRLIDSEEGNLVLWSYSSPS